MFRKANLATKYTSQRDLHNIDSPVESRPISSLQFQQCSRCAHLSLCRRLSPVAHVTTGCRIGSAAQQSTSTWTHRYESHGVLNGPACSSSDQLQRPHLRDQPWSNRQVARPDAAASSSILQAAGRGSGHQQLRHTPFIVSAVGGSYAADAGNEDEKKGEDNMISL